MDFSVSKNIFVVLVISAVLTPTLFFVIDKRFPPEPNGTMTAGLAGTTEIVQAQESQVPAYEPPKKLENPPEVIKAVYATGYSASSKRYLNYLKSLFETTDVNAVVVDLKGSDGRITWPNMISDIDSLVNFFHDQNVYLIGRISVFEDPVFAKARPDLAIYDKSKTAESPEPSRRVLWKDSNGQAWLDPSLQEVWDYNISLAKEAFYHGFDEINFDYVRFPSDGNIKNMGFPAWDGKKSKSAVIKEFFQYTRAQLLGQKISADLFGQTTINTDDMGIGQLLEDAFLSFDFICPMVYPSHYISGFIGFKNPAQHPYEVVKYSMDSALKRQQYFLMMNSESAGSPAALSKALEPEIKLAKLRPWLQDFNMGATYNAEMVGLEIKATQDSLGEDYNGFMLWNPNNIYTQNAILK